MSGRNITAIATTLEAVGVFWWLALRHAHFGRVGIGDASYEHEGGKYGEQVLQWLDSLAFVDKARRAVSPKLAVVNKRNLSHVQNQDRPLL